MIFSKLIASSKSQRHVEREAEMYRSLIRREAKIGGELFGPLPPGGRREFFCLDEHTWVWHEEWLNADGKRQIRTTRYDVRPNGILKAQGGTSYQKISPAEAERLLAAMKLYQQRVRSDLYAAYL